LFFIPLWTATVFSDPPALLLPAIILCTLATIIASQALI